VGGDRNDRRHFFARLLSEIASGDGRELDYPAPWAASARTSFLSTPADTRRAA
jgi:hypothetical protein